MYSTAAGTGVSMFHSCGVRVESRPEVGLCSNLQTRPSEIHSA
eukprot:SAG31_NODE_878_length_11297_cov_3.770714_3_plen_43_part_00